MVEDSLKFIFRQQKELATLSGIAALLGWDQMTYMPPMGAEERAEQTGLISRISHEKVISDKFWQHITKLSEPSTFEKLSEKEQAVVKRLRRDVEKARKIPSDFVEKMAKTTTLAYQSWEKARKKSDFNIFAPHLEKIIELEKEYVEYIKLPGSPYNSLLDDYEEGMTTKKLQQEFSYLKSQLIQLFETIKTSNWYENQQRLEIAFSSKEQRKLCEFVFEKMMLPKNQTRIDISTHPFTTSLGNNDVRITTNFERRNPLFSFFSTVHEGGHALYELGMPRDEFKDTVISDSPSLGLHESQSRFWENMIGRNKPFWRYFLPFFKRMSPQQFRNIGVNDWYRLLNQVKPSFIRVEADELTYCLHIILRFELEVMLMEEKITVSDLPQLWNEKMDEMLGIIPKNDNEGVLQDMHWSGGNIGYFPTYAIGTIYAAQLFKKLTEEKPGINEEIEKGDFTNILAWLREHVHRFGRLMTADEIIKHACGEGLNSKVFVSYLKEKYYDLYEI